MIPVEQTVFNSTTGNCIAASIASVLEMPLDDVPNFMADPTDDWWGGLQHWLKEQTGCQLLSMPPDVAAKEILHLWPGTYCLLSYIGPRQLRHCCVGRVGDDYQLHLAHNPWPGGPSMNGWELDEVKFFVRTNPAVRPQLERRA